MIQRLEQLEQKNRALKKELAECKKELEKLRKTAEYDFLTEVYNRHGFVRETERFLHEMKDEQLHKKMRRASIISGITILFIDVDDLKKMNDRFGHAEGDRYLRAIGRVLAKGVRAIDIVGRWGGDEFAVALINTTDVEAYSIAQKLSRSINRITLGKAVTDFVCSVSIGFVSIDRAQHQKTSYDLQTLIAHADKAMYEGKIRKGKGSIVSFSDIVG